jgi:hypothetical protein
VKACGFNPDNPLGAICYDFPASVRPELVEGFVLQRKWFDKALLSEVEGLTTNGLMDYLGLIMVFAGQGTTGSSRLICIAYPPICRRSADRLRTPNRQTV